MPEPMTRPEQPGTTTTQTNVLCEPVQYLEAERERLEEGMALCLSGGGASTFPFSDVGV